MINPCTVEVEYRFFRGLCYVLSSQWKGGCPFCFVVNFNPSIEIRSSGGDCIILSGDRKHITIRIFIVNSLQRFNTYESISF